MGRDAKYASELTEDIKVAATDLLAKVNSLLSILNIEKADVSSGWRPSAVNKSVGGAKASNHLTGHAVDLADPDKRLSKIILGNVDVLEECELWLESPEYTKTWIHLQSKPPKSGKLIFIP